jgi:hypothetical protein
MQPHYFQRALSPAGKSPRIGTSLLVHFLSALAVHCPNALDIQFRIRTVWLA